MSTYVPSFKICAFASNIEFWIGVPGILILVADIPPQILLAILLSMDHSSRYKLKVCNSHQREIIYSNSKFKVTYKKCRLWMPVHQDSYQREIEICNITFTIFPFLSEKVLKLNGHPEYLGVYYSWWNHQVHFKMIYFNKKKKRQNLELVNIKYVTLEQPVSLSSLQLTCL